MVDMDLNQQQFLTLLLTPNPDICMLVRHTSTTPHTRPGAGRKEFF
jgi:hypothetical protein